MKGKWKKMIKKLKQNVEQQKILTANSYPLIRERSRRTFQHTYNFYMAMKKKTKRENIREPSHKNTDKGNKNDRHKDKLKTKSEQKNKN